MTTPIRPVPDGIARWTSRMRWLRRLDAVAAWLILWGLLVLVAGAAAREGAVLAALVVGLGLAILPIRARWRPISGWASLALSRGLRPGDRAWHVRAQQADLVLVTGRDGIRLVIARPDIAGDEGLSVRRTRVLVLPAGDPLRTL